MSVTFWFVSLFCFLLHLIECSCCCLHNFLCILLVAHPGMNHLTIALRVNITLAFTQDSGVYHSIAPCSTPVSLSANTNATSCFQNLSLKNVTWLRPRELPTHCNRYRLLLFNFCLLHRPMACCRA